MSAYKILVKISPTEIFHLRRKQGGCRKEYRRLTRHENKIILFPRKLLSHVAEISLKLSVIWHFACRIIESFFPKFLSCWLVQGPVSKPSHHNRRSDSSRNLIRIYKLHRDPWMSLVCLLMYFLDIKRFSEIEMTLVKTGNKRKTCFRNKFHWIVKHVDLFDIFLLFFSIYFPMIHW